MFRLRIRQLAQRGPHAAHVHRRYGRFAHSPPPDPNTIGAGVVPQLFSRSPCHTAIPTAKTRSSCWPSRHAIKGSLAVWLAAETFILKFSGCVSNALASDTKHVAYQFLSHA